MKHLYTTLIVLLLGATTAFAQIDMSIFTETEIDYNPTTVILPESPLKMQVMFVGNSDFVQTGVNDSTEAKQWHDFIGFTPDETGASLGWVSVNHEMIQANDKIGDGGGMTVFQVKREPNTDTLIVMHQTLSDGRSGKFFNVDFKNTVGETGMNCGGITSFVDGRIWTAEEWFRRSNGGSSSIYAGGAGVRDTSDFTIGTTTPNGFPGFDGNTIKKFENFNYMVEIDPKEAVAIQKQYNWGRQGFEGGVVMSDNKTVYLGVDATPAFWLRFIADNAGDFTSGILQVYKQGNPEGQRWITINNSTMNDVLSIDAQAVAVGATMFNRIEWVTQDTASGIVYMTETGRDRPGSNWRGESIDGATHAQHHLFRGAQQGTHPDSSDYVDYYGRVLYYDTNTEELGIHLAGGPEFHASDSVNSSVYPEKHLSNPDGVGYININRQGYLIIQEDLNGTSHGRVPNDVTSNRTCEMFLLDLSIANPTTDDLIRITAVPIGAEVTGAVATSDGKTILVNSQHPNSDPNINPFPFNNSLTVAITGFDKLQSTTSIRDAFEQDKNEFKIFPNPVSRVLHFETPSDAAIYNMNGQQVRVVRHATSMEVSDIPAGVYVIKNLESGIARRLVIE